MIDPAQPACKRRKHRRSPRAEPKGYLGPARGVNSRWTLKARVHFVHRMLKALSTEQADVIQQGGAWPSANGAAMKLAVNECMQFVQLQYVCSSVTQEAPALAHLAQPERAADSDEEAESDRDSDSDDDGWHTDHDVAVVDAPVPASIPAPAPAPEPQRVACTSLIAGFKRTLTRATLDDNVPAAVQSCAAQQPDSIAEQPVTAGYRTMAHLHRNVGIAARKYTERFLRECTVRDAPPCTTGYKLRKNAPHLKELHALLQEGWLDADSKPRMFSGLEDCKRRCDAAIMAAQLAGQVPDESKFANIQAACGHITSRTLWKQLQAVMGTKLVKQALRRMRDKPRAQVRTRAHSSLLTVFVDGCAVPY